MSNQVKNIIVVIELNIGPEYAHWKAAHSYLNRFTIDEDAAFELLGVYYFKKCRMDLMEQSDEFVVERKLKVKVSNSKDKRCILEL